MQTFGLIVEGDYDAAALQEFLRRCAGEDAAIVSRPCGSGGSLINRFRGFLEEFRYAKGGAPVDKAFIMRDADQKNPDELIKKMQSMIFNRTYPFPVKFVIIVRELETWLLADNEAIIRIVAEYSNRRASKIRIQEIIGTLEEIQDPKTRLQKILSDAKIAYTRNC